MSKVKMSIPEATTDVEKDNKIPYDDLMNIANKLSASNAELQRRLNDAMLNNFFTRLDFLFRVISNSDKFPEDFVKKCIDEITEAMSLSESDNEKEADKE